MATLSKITTGTRISTRIIGRPYFSMQMGAGETFGGMDLVLSVPIDGREFTYLRLGGTVERDLFFIKKLQGEPIRNCLPAGISKEEAERDFKLARRAVGHHLGIYPYRGILLAYLQMLFMFHKNQIKEVWNLCLNLGEDRTTFHVDSPINGQIRNMPGFEKATKNAFGQKREVDILERAAVSILFGSLTRQEFDAVQGIVEQIVPLSDFMLREDPWLDVTGAIIASRRGGFWA